MTIFKWTFTFLLLLCPLSIICMKCHVVGSTCPITWHRCCYDLQIRTIWWLPDQSESSSSHCLTHSFCTPIKGCVLSPAPLIIWAYDFCRHIVVVISPLPFVHISLHVRGLQGGRTNPCTGSVLDDYNPWPWNQSTCSTLNYVAVIVHIRSMREGERGELSHPT